MTKSRLFLSAVAIVVIVAGPLLAHAGVHEPRPIVSFNASTEDRALGALKKKHDCARKAKVARTYALEAGWKIHQAARDAADAAYREMLLLTNATFAACAKNKETCEEKNALMRKQAHKDRNAAYSKARKAWKDERKKSAGEFKAAKSTCAA